jgi:rhomboid family GlyGly-CTERM serine protease
MLAMLARLRRVVAAECRLGISPPLAVIAVVIACAPPLAEALQYERAAVHAGEHWRLITCHWTHWSADHLFWDVLAFALLASLCERLGRLKMIACTLMAAIVIGASVEVVLPGIHAYRGLSGIDSALFALAVTTLLRRAVSARRRKSAMTLLVCLVAFLGKTAFECTTGMTLFVNSAAAGMTPVPLVHIIGAIVGLGVGCWCRRSGAECSVTRRRHPAPPAFRPRPAAPTPLHRAPIARTPR